MASNVTPREALVTVAVRVLSDWNYKAALLAKGRPHADDVKAQKTVGDNFGEGHRYIREPMEVDTALEHVAATWGTESGARQWITWGAPGEAERLTSAACRYFAQVSMVGYARLANEVEAKAAERVRVLLAAEEKAHNTFVLENLTKYGEVIPDGYYEVQWNEVEPGDKVYTLGTIAKDGGCNCPYGENQVPHVYGPYIVLSPMNFKLYRPGSNRQFTNHDPLLKTGIYTYDPTN